MLSSYKIRLGKYCMEVSEQPGAYCVLSWCVMPLAPIKYGHQQRPIENKIYAELIIQEIAGCFECDEVTLPPYIMLRKSRKICHKC